MVLTKEINKKIVIAAIIVSLFLIVGSIYLHLRQKTHLGRMNIGDRRAKPTVGVENLPNDDDVIYVPPLQQTPTQASQTQTVAIETDYTDTNGYVNDLSHFNTMTVEYSAEVESSKHSIGITKSTESFVMGNDYSPYNSAEYEYPSSEEYDKASRNDKLGLLSTDCLSCLCKTVNDCKPIKCSHNDPCGIYGISKYYWLDGGKQTTLDNLNDYSEKNEEYRDYLRCVNNERCATETVQNYMKRYQRDCNKDGKINCQDYIALHLLGPTGCRSKQISPIHKFRMDYCSK